MVDSIFWIFLSFQDPVIKSALPVIHLIDSMKSGVIDYSIVKSGQKLVAQVIIIILNLNIQGNLEKWKRRPNDFN